MFHSLPVLVPNQMGIKSALPLHIKSRSDLIVSKLNCLLQVTPRLPPPPPAVAVVSATAAAAATPVPAETTVSLVPTVPVTSGAHAHHGHGDGNDSALDLSSGSRQADRETKSRSSVVSHHSSYQSDQSSTSAATGVTDLLDLTLPDKNATFEVRTYIRKHKTKDNKTQRA